METDFQAQRAVLKAELTAIAVAGGDTAGVRNRLAKLDERQQVASEAAAEARAAIAAEHAAFAAERGTMIAMDAVHAIEAQGYDVTDADVEQFKYFGCRIAAMDAETVAASNEHVAAVEQVRLVENRMTKLQERSQALSDLRLTGRASERDMGEALLLEKDIVTLGSALVEAQRNADALQVPAERLHQRAAVMQQLMDLEKAIVLRNLKERTAAAEAGFLNLLRELVQVSGVGHPGHVYTRSRELDRYVHHGVLWATPWRSSIPPTTRA